MACCWLQIAWQTLLTLVLLGTFFASSWAEGAKERLLVPVAHLNQELEALGLRAEDLTLLLDGVPMASKATEVCEEDACELSFPLHQVIASIST